MLWLNLLVRQKQRDRHRGTKGHQGGKGEGDNLGDWDRHIYTNVYKMDSLFDAQETLPNALQRPEWKAVLSRGCLYTQLTHCAEQQRLIQHWEATMP